MHYISSYLVLCLSTLSLAHTCFKIVWKTKPSTIFVDYLHGLHLQKLYQFFYRHGLFNQPNPCELMAVESSQTETFLIWKTFSEIIDCFIRCASMSFVCPKGLYEETLRRHANDKRRAPSPKPRPTTDINKLQLQRAAELTTVELKSRDKLMKFNHQGQL